MYKSGAHADVAVGVPTVDATPRWIKRRGGKEFSKSKLGQLRCQHDEVIKNLGLKLEGKKKKKKKKPFAFNGIQALEMRSHPNTLSHLGSVLRDCFL
ncbi:hypothetical protein MUK42_37758 [Musa troglodytarum]|uniref:Uncharacterized protein n=1 Tax=Musa troglodytarum TaxID=320322 RepID=A0A9E7GKU8_9LILI|nr:hypothetical protein MUK42_37758 [Musa troglodytarum]